MALPDFQSFFKPLLQIASDGKEHSLQEARETIAKTMVISEEDLKELLPSGIQTKFENRIAWAKSFFVQAKVFETPRRGHFRITQRGRDLLKQGHQRIDIKVLNQFPEFVEFRTSKSPRNEEPEPITETP
jgi:restriction system protein